MGRRQRGRHRTRGLVNVLQSPTLSRSAWTSAAVVCRICTSLPGGRKRDSMQHLLRFLFLLVPPLLGDRAQRNIQLIGDKAAASPTTGLQLGTRWSPQLGIRGKRKENDREKEGDITRGSPIALSRTSRINDEEAEACSDDVSRSISYTKRLVILDNAFKKKMDTRVIFNTIFFTYFTLIYEFASLSKNYLFCSTNILTIEF